MSLVEVGHPSPPVLCRMVAMWSQFQANGARNGVWRPAFLTAMEVEHQRPCAASQSA